MIFAINNDFIEKKAKFYIFIFYTKIRKKLSRDSLLYEKKMIKVTPFYKSSSNTARSKRTVGPHYTGKLLNLINSNEIGNHRLFHGPFGSRKSKLNLF